MSEVEDDDASGDIQIISVNRATTPVGGSLNPADYPIPVTVNIPLAVEQINTADNRIRAREERRRRIRRMRRPHPIISVDDENENENGEEEDDDEGDIEIVEERRLVPPPAQPPLPPPENDTDDGFVIHAPGRVFPTRQQQRRIETRSFANMNTTGGPNSTGPRIRSRREIQQSYLLRRQQERQRAEQIRGRFYRSNQQHQHLYDRIAGIIPRDIRMGLGNLLFPGNINNLFFRDNDNSSNDTTDDDDWVPGMHTAAMVGGVGGGGQGYGYDNDDDESRETEYWINRVQQLENDENDIRIRKRLKYSATFEKKLTKRLVPKDIQEKFGYLNTVKANKKNVCVQCGVELGEGIPGASQDNATSTTSTSTTKNLEDLVKQNRCPAPYQSSTTYTEDELLNSKKIFFSQNCGHLYCGRCIDLFKGHRSPLSAKKKQKRIKVYPGQGGEADDDEYYEIYENGQPILNLRKCCAYNCGASLHKFRELYF